jgi:hypothetical protein
MIANFHGSSITSEGEEMDLGRSDLGEGDFILFWFFTEQFHLYPDLSTFSLVIVSSDLFRFFLLIRIAHLT